MGAKAAAAVTPELVALLASDDPAIQLRAGHALGKIGDEKNALAAAAVLVKLLESNDPDTARRAAAVLQGMGKPAGAVLLPLLRYSRKDPFCNYPPASLAPPSLLGVYLCGLLQTETNSNTYLLTHRITAVLATRFVLKDDPSVFMMHDLEHSIAPQKARAWLLCQTAGDENFRWLYEQIQGRAKPEGSTAHAAFLKETLDKVQANQDAKELFPEAYGKLLRKLEALRLSK